MRFVDDAGTIVGVDLGHAASRPSVALQRIEPTSLALESRLCDKVEGLIGFVPTAMCGVTLEAWLATAQSERMSCREDRWQLDRARKNTIARRDHVIMTQLDESVFGYEMS